eukprot:SAG11_NODE_723_length_7528_cov_4.998385_11_plen_47_part_00
MSLFQCVDGQVVYSDAVKRQTKIMEEHYFILIIVAFVLRKNATRSA